MGISTHKVVTKIASIVDFASQVTENRVQFATVIDIHIVINVVNVSCRGITLNVATFLVFISVNAIIKQTMQEPTIILVSSTSHGNAIHIKPIQENIGIGIALPFSREETGKKHRGNEPA